MVGSSSPQACSIRSLNNGDSHTKFQHHTTIKVMEKWKQLYNPWKRSSGHHGMGDLSVMISSVGHCCNTGTLLPTEMGYPHTEALRTPCARHHTMQHTTDPSPKNGNSKQNQQNSKQAIPSWPLKILQSICSHSPGHSSWV